MYRFADLTHEQKLMRRELLDYYAVVAQASVLIPLLVISSLRLYKILHARLQNGTASQIPSSPYVKAAKSHYKYSYAGIKDVWQRFQWNCGDSLRLWRFDVGTKGEILAAVVFTAWLLVLTFVQTGDDYLHLTKRAGAIGASQLPFHYLLSLKTPYSPLQVMTGCSHERFISTHQVLGRIITTFFWMHAVLYINFYVLSGLLWSKLQELYVICGVVGILAFTIIGTSSLKPARDWNYRVFYTIHVTLATALLPILYFHVHHIRTYLYETLAIYVLNTVFRFFSTTTHSGSIRQIRGTNLAEVKIPLTKGSSKWLPGQHVYISLQGHPFTRTFRSNPFTVASIPHVDGQLRFMARILDGNTRKLAQSIEQNQRISVEGPYGLATHADKLLTYDRVLFIAGGIGSTFTVPLYRQLLSDLSPSKGSARRQKVEFVWAARSLADTAWAIDTLDEKERGGFLERLQIHLTQNSRSETSSQLDKAFVIDEDDQGPDEEGIELEQRRNLLSEDATIDVKTEGHTELPIQYGRPDLALLIETLFAHSGTERVAIIVCGPRALSRSIRREVGRFALSGREVWLHEECFGT